MKPLNNVKFYSLFRVFMIYIDFKYHPHKFAVDMVQRGDDFKNGIMRVQQVKWDTTMNPWDLTQT